MDVWETIRIRCRRNREKVKTVARDLGLSPNTVREYLRKDSPPKRKPRADVKTLTRYQSHIDNLILSTPKITAARVGSYLRQNVDADLVADERTLRRYVAGRRAVLVPREAFIRASYGPADQSQFDFSPMSVRLAGVLVVIQLFVLRLSYSGRFMSRLLAGFTAFGGVTRSSIFDNASTAVTRILRGRDRDQNAKFAEFRGGLSLNVEFAAPAKGNQKGGVEGTHGFIEDNFFRPIPDFADFDELNRALVVFSDASLTRIIAPNTESIAERFAREQPLLLPLPSVLPRACVSHYVKVNKFAEVRFERNSYSVPTQYALRDAVVEAYDERLRIIVSDEVVAQHPRGFGVDKRYLDLVHYVGLLKYKHRAAETALVLADGRIPQVFHDLFARYCEENNSTATRRWTQVLALLADTSVDELAQTITHALALGTDDPSAIELLLRQRSLPHAAADLDKAQLPVSAQFHLPNPDLNLYATTQLMEGS
jgi:transposase